MRRTTSSCMFPSRQASLHPRRRFGGSVCSRRAALPPCAHPLPHLMQRSMDDGAASRRHCPLAFCTRTRLEVPYGSGIRVIATERVVCLGLTPSSSIMRLCFDPGLAGAPTRRAAWINGVDARVDARINVGVDAGVDVWCDAWCDAWFDAWFDARVDARVDAISIRVRRPCPWRCWRDYLRGRGGGRMARGTRR